jgi:glycosyltransferase involved in cell wall biosynthesis
VAALAAKDCPVTLAVLGEGSRRKKLESLAVRLGIADRVTFKGNVPAAECRRLLAGSDIFVTLYDYSNLGNALIEAMATGLPVVTLDNGDTGTVVKRPAGVVVRTGDAVEGTVAAILGLLNDRKLMARTGAAARIRARRLFTDWSARIRMELKMIEEVAGCGA